MKSHALLSASGAHRWLNCTAAPRLEENIEDSSSSYAAEGTLAHDIGEAMLLGDKKALTKLKKHDLFYPGMIDEVEEYTSYCLERLNEMLVTDPVGAHMAVEQRLDLTDCVPDGFGTGDCIIIGNGLLEIIDLKFGKGVAVDVEDNPQLMLYALGALKEFGFMYEIDTVRMTIAQVRTIGITSYDMKVKDLEYWAEHVVKPKAKEAFAGDAPPNPGDWCRFCKFRTRCKARADKYNVLYSNSPIKEAMTNDDIADILKELKDMQAWLTDIENYALEKALEGEVFKGWKLVEGRSNRKLTDESAIAEILLGNGFKEEVIYKPLTLETITALEKIVGKKAFTELVGNYIVKPKGKPTLVTEVDKRPALNSVENEFEFN